MFEIKGKYTTAKVMIDGVEETCMAQLYSMVSHPSFVNPIAIMPDCHAGKGCVVGFTMEIGNNIIPNIVGSDVGCGMLSVNIGKNLFMTMTKQELDDVIRKVIPFGTNIRQKKSVFAKFEWKRINKKIHDMTLKFNERYKMSVTPTVYDDDKLELLAEQVRCGGGKLWNSIGTLGGGNHFIEIGKSLSNEYWITFHSGSRNFGKCVAEYHQKIACIDSSGQTKEQYVKYVKDTFPKGKWGEEIAKYTTPIKKVEKGMEYLEGLDMYNYLVDMIVAQEYACLNRKVMKMELMKVLFGRWNLLENNDGFVVLNEIETIHNFVDSEDWVIRKGAIRSYVGEKMIIPFNPADGILICEGKSNPEWNCSAPHGAGRIMSRSQAKKSITKEMAHEVMKGVFTTCTPLDESPLVYKKASIIEECIEPTANILDRLIPVMNLKCGE